MIDPPQAGNYRTLVIDPPWYNSKTSRRGRARQSSTNHGPMPYAVMPYSEIAALPVGDWAAPQATLFLWATNGRDHSRGRGNGDVPVLRSALDLLDEWGFRFFTMLTWYKPSGVCPVGPWIITTEYVLVAYRGSFDLPGRMGGERTAYSWPRARGHSSKPDEFYRMLRDNTHGPRLDVFARTVKHGFDGWGDQYPDLSRENQDAT